MRVTENMDRAVPLWFGILACVLIASRATTCAVATSDGQSAAAGHAGTAWMPLDTATRAAASQRKNILYFVTAGTCAECRYVEEAVFDDAETMSRIALRYVLVRIDAGAAPAGVTAQRLPAFIARDQYGREVGRLEGIRSKRFIVRRLMAWPEPAAHAR